MKYTCDDINPYIYCSKFHNELKEADIVPVHKKESKLFKKNYRPISILPNISKVYERSLSDQMSESFDDFFANYQFVFRKGYRVQHCFLVMIEKWKKKVVDNGCAFGPLLLGLSKAFDCFLQYLLFPKWRHMDFK